jgi:hypothetical protein
VAIELRGNGWSGDSTVSAVGDRWRGGAPKDNEDGGADGRRGRPPEDDERWSDGGLTSARFKPTDHAQPRPTFKNQ